MNQLINVEPIASVDLPENDYVSPGLAIVLPDSAFPNMIVGDTSVPQWPYLRRWVEHNWYTDRRNPDAGFVNRDEAAILYNSALLFRGKSCLEIGCWYGWSTVHLALGTGYVDVIDPLLGNHDFAASVTASCAAAGVLDGVSLHSGASPDAIHTLAEADGKRWSLIFIDGDHEGNAPRRDAEAARLYAADTAMMLFHDLASPYVARGLDAMRDAGWHTMVYQTMQIMGVAWRGNVQPIVHVPDPKVFWTLPRHLGGYAVSGWTPPALPAGGATWTGMTVRDRHNAAMLRAQLAEDDLVAVQMQLAVAEARMRTTEVTVALRDEALARHNALLADYTAAIALREQAIAQRDTALVERIAAATACELAQGERDAAVAERDDALMQLAVATALREQALVQGDVVSAHVGATNAEIARLGGHLTALIETIATTDRNAAVHALADRQEAAQHRLAAWVLQRRVLLALMCRAPAQRIAIVRSRAAALGAADLATEPFLRWLCRRRTLLGLLRRSTWRGEVAVQGGLQAHKHLHATSCPEPGLAGAAGWLDRWFATGCAARVQVSAPTPALARYAERLGFSASATDAWVALLTTRCVPATRRTLLATVAGDLAKNLIVTASAARVRASALFDEAFYRYCAELADPKADAALHYLLFGELLGFAPSAGFDPVHYTRQNPDVVEAGVSSLLHYDETGREEGRSARPAPEAHPQSVVLAPGGPMLPSLAVLNHWLACTAKPAGRWQSAVAVPMLKRYFKQLGFASVDAAAWASMLTLETPTPAQCDAAARSLQDNTELWTLAERVRRCPQFDDKAYRNIAGLAAANLDAALHYLLLGEPLGFCPSAGFDPRYYACRYSDILAAGVNCLLHYDAAGRSEGRKPLPPSGLSSNPLLIDSKRDNVIVVVHDASRTGAPILCWNIARLLAQRYNIYTVRLGDGPLTPEFEALSAEVYGPVTGRDWHPVDMEFGLRRLFAGRTFKFAIVNSIESRPLLEICARRGVPTVLLMHEFGSYVRPLVSLHMALDLATEIVFPAPIVARSTIDAYPPLLDRAVRIQPQGMSIIPSRDATKKTPPRKQMRALTAARANGALLVIGAGTVIIRKGVDLFIAVAAEVQRLALTRAVHFLWIGHGYQPNEDMGYSVYLKEQLERSGLQDTITFMDEVSDLDSIYNLAHVFLLTSRLDPLPNVSIDAAWRGIPTICFRDASGTADLLLADPETAQGVVPHLDVAAAAALIGRLAMDEPARLRMAQTIGELARRVFDMQDYVAQIDALATATAAVSDRIYAEAEILRADSSFDQCLSLGPGWEAIGRDEAILQYLAIAPQRRRGAPLAQTTPMRRPMPGFHPWIWAAAHPTPECKPADPLADFIRHGHPPGPWLLPLLRPAPDIVSAAAAGQQRALLHVHLENPDFAPELLAALRANASPCDLLLTTGDSARAARLRNALPSYGQGSITVLVVPPGDSDGLRPMLASLAAGTPYDFVGHVHDGLATFGSDARQFHWQNMLGGHYAMRDRILAAFSQQADLGVVYPADPHLVGWGELRAHTERLASRLSLRQPLPDTFDFPAGAMFWARTAVLQALLPLVPADGADEDESGTWQSAFLRLLPFAAEAAGLSQAVTHVPGVTL